MKKILLSIFLSMSIAGVTKAQITPVAPSAIPDTAVNGRIVVHKDPRIELLASKQAPKDLLGPRAAKGYRLMILNTNDRDLALRVRSQLLQRFPEQKVYMSFKPPYIQLKFGNFVEKAEAERYKTLVKKGGLVSTNIYAVPEIVEVKAPKEDEKDR